MSAEVKAVRELVTAFAGGGNWDGLWDTRYVIFRGDFGIKMCEKCGTHTLKEALEPLGFTSGYGMWPPPAHVWFVCRNPYSRAVSSWWDITHEARHFNEPRIKEWGGESFAHYVRYLTSGREHMSPASIHHTQAEWVGGVDLEGFIRLEELDTELPKLVPGAKVQHLGATDHEHWSTYYDMETAQMIAGWAREDFTRFDYPMSYDSWNP